MKKTAKIIFIVIAAIASLFIILGIVNDAQTIPAETTYTYESKQSFGHYIERFTCKLGGNYEYKYYISGELRAACSDKYEINGNEITFYNLMLLGNNYPVNKKYKLVGGTIADKYKSGGSWLTTTLVSVGSAIFILDIGYVLYLYWKLGKTHKAGDVTSE